MEMNGQTIVQTQPDEKLKITDHSGIKTWKQLEMHFFNTLRKQKQL